MIYNLTLFDTAQFEIKWELDQCFKEYVTMCVVKKSPAVLISSSDKWIIISYEILSNNIIEIYRKEENGNSDNS